MKLIIVRRVSLLVLVVVCFGLILGCENSLLPLIENEVLLHRVGVPNISIRIGTNSYTDGDTYDIGNQIVNDQVTITAYIDNSGTGEARLTGANYVDFAVGDVFSCVQPSQSTIPIGGSVAFDLVFEAKASIQYNDTLTVEFNGNESPLEITVTGTGITSGVVSTPSLSPTGGTYNSAQLVTISTTPADATIRYTTDGSTPSESVGNIYTGEFTISQSRQVRAIAYKSGWQTSSVGSATYTLKASSPSISPSSGTYWGGTSTSMTTSTSGASIYYTTNGTTPTTSSTLYSGAFDVSDRTTVRAIAAKSGWSDSDVATRNYTVPFSDHTTLASVSGGWPTDIDGDFVIVGSPQSGTGGQAFIYQRTGDNTWSSPAILNSGNPETNGKFGFDVAISGLFAIVSAPYENSSKGRVYLFKRGSGNSWTRVETFTCPSAAPTDAEFYGWSIDISQQDSYYLYIVIGAPYEGEDTLEQSGAVYRLEYRIDLESINHTKRTIATNQQWYAHYGQSVATTNDFCLAGAPSEGTTGAAYYFPTNWTSSMYRITPSDGNTDDDFGRAVAMSDDWAIVGAPEHDLSGKTNSGAVYTYHVPSWFAAGAKLYPSDVQASDFIGRSIGVSGNRVLIGSPQGDLPGLTDAGYTYVFDYSGSWTERPKLTAENPVATNKFGYSPSCDGEYVVISDRLGVFAIW